MFTSLDLFSVEEGGGDGDVPGIVDGGSGGAVVFVVLVSASPVVCLENSTVYLLCIVVHLANKLKTSFRLRKTILSCLLFIVLV